MEEARAVLPFVKSMDDKYNVLYVNTPWNAMEESTLSKFPAAGITPDNAALFLWVDSYTVAKATKLLDEWGFKFHSVYQVLDVAKYPWMEKGKVKAAEDTPTVDTPAADTPAADTPAADTPAADTPAADTTEADTPGSSDKTQTKKKVNRKPRAPPINPPHWWTAAEGGANTPSRPTTEQLWLAVKGDPSSLFTNVSLAFNVINCPELGKKSRSKKVADLGEWESERPDQFLSNVMRHLTPEAKLLNVFASSINTSVDTWGPGVPGGYLSSFKGNTGVVGVLNKVMRAMKKTQLHELCLKLPRVLKEEEGVALKDVPPWAPIETAMAEMAGNPGHDFRHDDGKIKNWAVELALCLSQRNMANFSVLHSRKKKRKVAADTNPDRQRHGIASKSVVSKELAEFLGLKEGETIARTQVVSLLNKYISAENLKDPVKKNQIILDEKLSVLLAPPPDFGVITFFNICRLLKPHFPKSKKAIKEEEAAKKATKDGTAAAKGQETPVGHDDKKVCQSVK